MDENAADPPTHSELTDEQRTRMDAWLAAHPYGEQDENGVDLSLIRTNLRLTPSARYRKHQNALRTLQAVRNAGRKLGFR